MHRNVASGSWPADSHTNIDYSAPGKTRPVVLVHGLGVSADYMLPTLVRLARDFKVLAPELPGFGKSDKPSHVLDIGELADVLAEWMGAVDIPSAVFLGNSMGCQVIVDLAARYPLLVDAAILVGPTVDTIGHTMIQQLWRGLLDLIHEPWSLWRILARDYLRTGTRRIYRTFRFALHDDVLRKCLTITAPALLVRGGYDTIAPARWVEEIATTMPECTRGDYRRRHTRGKLFGTRRSRTSRKRIFNESARTLKIRHSVASNSSSVVSSTKASSGSRYSREARSVQIVAVAQICMAGPRGTRILDEKCGPCWRTLTFLARVPAGRLL